MRLAESLPPMSKMTHASLVGKLTYDEDDGYLIDGFSVGQALGSMEGQEVQFELIGYEKTPTAPVTETPPADDEFLRKLLGGE